MVGTFTLERVCLVLKDFALFNDMIFGTFVEKQH